MDVLIVGAGSVGQLYGHILQRGGATVGVYVKPKYTDDAHQGFRLYNRKKGLRDGEQFTPDAVHSSPEELSDTTYDAAILCIPSTGLRGPWFEPFVEALGDDTTVVSLTPGLEDRDYITDYVDETRVAVGMITAVAYPAPMPGEDAEAPGTAYWFPPFTPAMFDGPKQRLHPLLKTLKSGGMSTRLTAKLAELAAFGTGILMPLVATLETVDWSFDELKHSGDRRELFAQATDEITEVLEDHLQARPPLPMRMLGKTTIKGALMMAPVAAPFDLETYLEVHFTKVSSQTRQILDDYLQHRQQRGLESPAISQLRQEIGDVCDD